MAKKIVAKSKSEETLEENKNCFVIMPFGGLFDIYFETIYKAAIEEVGLICNRADDLTRSSNIVNDIWNYTKSADVILADLTGRNPNVFYELGLGHAITKPAILITESIEDVPFDLRSLRIILYDKNYPNWGDKLKVNITKALVETLKNPEEAVPPTFLDISKSQKIEVDVYEKELLEVKSELNSLKREVRSITEPAKFITGSRLNYNTTPQHSYLKWGGGQEIAASPVSSVLSFKPELYDGKIDVVDLARSNTKE